MPDGDRYLGCHTFGVLKGARGDALPNGIGSPMTPGHGHVGSWWGEGAWSRAYSIAILGLIFRVSVTRQPIGAARHGKEQQIECTHRLNDLLEVGHEIRSEFRMGGQRIGD